VEENYEKNRLLISYNPLMAIALSSEILIKVMKTRKKFENECKRVKKEMLRLGQMYISKIEDERYYEKLIMETDFKGRSVLKIIISNKFEPLMDDEDPKAENLMLKIWHGKESTKCDGTLTGYSSMTHILFSQAKKSSAVRASFIDVASNSFRPNFNVDYL